MSSGALLTRTRAPIINELSRFTPLPNSKNKPCNEAGGVSAPARRVGPGGNRSFQGKGATDEDLKEAAFARLVLRTVLEKHAGEIRSDPGFRQAVFRLVFEKATPELRRAWAKRERAEGNLEIAYRFEQIADHRERGEWMPSE